MQKIGFFALVSLLLSALASLAQTPPCAWQPGFHGRGPSGDVLASAVFDDGTGPALYVGGTFLAADGVRVNHVAKWDGAAWSALGDGFDHHVRALVVFDDGRGPALYAGGDFEHSGDVVVANIAKWDGSAFSPLGDGLDGVAEGRVRALAVFDNGSGPALYAGGDFTLAGGSSASRIAKWDGAAWSPLGSGIGGLGSAVHSLAVYDDGGGDALYVGGSFNAAGGSGASDIAAWDGSAFSPLGSGMNGDIFALKAHEGFLYAGGDFSVAGGVSANRVARWNGSAWSTAGSGMDGPVRAFTVLDDGGAGSVLYAGGDFQEADALAAPHLAAWQDGSWSGVGSGPSAPAWTLAAWTGANDGLFAGLEENDSPSAVLWDGITYQGLSDGSGLGVAPILSSGGVAVIEDFAVFDDGSGPALYVAGLFDSVGGVAAERIARWDGESWSEVGGGLGGGAGPWANRVFALEVFDDGSGPALYAVGDFTVAGGSPASYIAKWDGSTWSPLGVGLDYQGYALKVFDNGSGPKLYVGGAFTSPAAHIASWDGLSWSAVGTQTLSGAVYAFEIFDDGSGPALFVGGELSIVDEFSFNSIAKLDSGGQWVALGHGLEGAGDNARAAFDLAVFDRGSGPELFVGGDFLGAFGLTSQNLVIWNGSSWSASTWPRSFVYDLEVFDDGNGPALYVGSESGLDRWQASGWQDVGIGGSHPGVLALEAFDDGTGQALFAGGSFPVARDAPSSRIAQYACAANATIPALAVPHVAAPVGEPVVLPVELGTASQVLAGTSFSIDYDESCLSFSDTDSNGDGVPDAFSYSGPAGYSLLVDVDPADTDGEIDVSLFDAAPAAPLPDGVLATLAFDVDCEVSERAVATVAFSRDPAATFSDDGAADVEGLAFGGSVELFSGLRGDCNGGASLGNADLVATDLEIFDGDGDAWSDAGGGSFPGDALGCDANADLVIDAGDLSCIHRLIFGQDCVTAPFESAAARLELAPWELPVIDGRSSVTLTVYAEGSSINSLVASLDLDTERFTFDETDSNGDGLADSVEPHGIRPALLEVRWDPLDADGELDLTLSDASAFAQTFSIEIEVIPLAPAAYVAGPFGFSADPAPSAGRLGGQSLPVNTSIPVTGLFADGFESGDLSAWSAPLP